MDDTNNSLSSLLGDFDNIGVKKRKERKKWKPPPATKNWIDIYKTHTKALLDSAETAREHLKDLKKGDLHTILSKGSCSMEHMLAAVAEQIGECDLYVMCWAINQAAIMRFSHAQKIGFLRHIRVLVDERMRMYKPKALDILVGSIGAENVALGVCHAKVYVLHSTDSDGMSFSISSSANLNHNPRLESSIMIEGRDVAEWWIDEIELQIKNGQNWQGNEYDTGQ